MGWCCSSPAVVLLVAPPAVDQASDFSDELPATVRDLYSWPIIGDRLEEADAAGEVEEAIDDLPARIDDETLAELGERLLGGAFSTVVVVIAAIGVLADGEVIVRRVRAVVPPSRQAAGRRGGPDRLPLLRQLLRRLAARRGAQRPLRPHRRARCSACRSRRSPRIWAALTNFIPQIGGFLGGAFFVLLALTESPTTAVIAGVLFLAYQQFENNVVGPGHRRQRGEPHPARHDAGRPRRRRGGRRARRARGHARCSAPARRSTSRAGASCRRRRSRRSSAGCRRGSTR